MKSNSESLNCNSEEGIEQLVYLEENEPSYEYNGRHYELLYANNYVDPGFLTADIPFWIDMASQYGSPVLELCCGTGRVAASLAEKGFSVTGIDISDSMLSEAKRKTSQVNWMRSDITNFKLDKKFSLIIIPGNSLGHLLDLESIESCLSCIRKHLQPEGRLIIDLVNNYSRDNLEFYLDKSPVLFSTYPDPDGKGEITVTCRNEVDFSTQINREEWLFKFIEQGKEVTQEVKYRFYASKELETLLRYNGFSLESNLGDYDKNPFTTDSPNHIVISSVQN
jgi:SAM-dependent methyltransferase